MVLDQPLPSREPDHYQLGAMILRRRELRGFVGDKGIAAAAYTAGIQVQRWIAIERGVGTLSMDDYARMAIVLEPGDADVFATRLQRLGGYDV